MSCFGDVRSMSAKTLPASSILLSTGDCGMVRVFGVIIAALNGSGILGVIGFKDEGL